MRPISGVLRLRPASVSRFGVHDAAAGGSAEEVAAEHRIGLGHAVLDEGVAHAGALRCSAVLTDHLGYRLGGDEVVNDDRAGMTRELLSRTW